MATASTDRNQTEIRVDATELATLIDALEGQLDTLVDTRQQGEMETDEERAELDAEIDRVSSLLALLVGEERA